MDPNEALLAGLAAGLAIAVQIGAVSLLLVETALVGGARAAVAAGLGVATTDLIFAAVAAAAGGGAGVALSSHETEIRLVAAATLAAIAVHGLIALARSGVAAAPDAEQPLGLARAGGRRAHYARFLAITAANPLTIVSFAAIAAALSFDGPFAAAASACGVGLGSAAWHLVLTVAAGHARRWITPRIRLGLAVGGRLVVLAIAVHLALGGGPAREPSTTGGATARSRSRTPARRPAAWICLDYAEDFTVCAVHRRNFAREPRQ